ncbi:Nonaspanin (TM9SF) protein [Dioscorea alata]|uniref:Nonaspanin (TM9SF) protein n=1 Tax=Dioscorea alata TaxID=55571 RepID=A0ACB7VD52_DIOAL|nr:Nonaspanin (TM9SF) protein [Dioscorea alata]
MAIPRFGTLRALMSVAFVLLIVGSEGFYLPGVAPADFKRKDPLHVKVNKLTSTKTQLPYSYYYLPFCKPDIIVDSAENLGEVLRGDRIENSPYVFEMREPQMCNIVCKMTLTNKGTRYFKEKIDDEYRVNMILDNLPLVVPAKRGDEDLNMIYQLGYYVGFKDTFSGAKDEQYFLYNHLSFTVKYHKDPDVDLARIVGFEVRPFSVKHDYEGEWLGNKTRLNTCDPHAKQIVVNSANPQEVDANKDIIFTYDVEFKESDVKWASRWDIYLLMADAQIHWFSIVNSMMIVLFLSGMVAMIMLRTLYRDISKYNQLETQEEAQEETGWKLVHGDVFRPPANSDLLCVYVGTGVQFFGMLLVTMLFAALGFLSPSNRGGTDDSHGYTLGAHGYICGILFCPSLQNVQRYGMEEDHIEDSLHVPWNHLRYLLNLECTYLGSEVLWCGAVHHHVCSSTALVRHLSTSIICR